MWCGRGWCLSPCVSSGKVPSCKSGNVVAGPGDDQARFLADLRSARLRRDRVRRTGGPGALPERRPEGSRERPWPSRPAHSHGIRPRLRGGRADWEERWRRLNPRRTTTRISRSGPPPAPPPRPVPARASASRRPTSSTRSGSGPARGVHSRTGQTSRRSGDSSSPPRPRAVPAWTAHQGLSADAGVSADGWGTNSGWDPAPDA
jgi:hypothetical protein